MIIINHFIRQSVRLNANVAKNMKYRKLSGQAKAQQSWRPVTDAHGQT